jgi:hypothetical protein
MKVGDYFQSKTKLVVRLTKEDDRSYHYRVVTDNQLIEQRDSSLRKDIFEYLYKPMEKSEVVKWSLRGRR